MSSPNEPCLMQSTKFFTVILSKKQWKDRFRCEQNQSASRSVSIFAHSDACNLACLFHAIAQQEQSGMTSENCLRLTTHCRWYSSSSVYQQICYSGIYELQLLVQCYPSLTLTYSDDLVLACDCVYSHGLIFWLFVQHQPTQSVCRSLMCLSYHQITKVYPIQSSLFLNQHASS